MVLPAKRNVIVGQVDEAAVGNRDAVCQAAEMVENLLQTAERLLGIDDSLSVPRTRNVADELNWRGQIRQPGEEPQFACLEGML